MQKFSLKPLYKKVFWFQLFLLAITVLPFIILKLFLKFSQLPFETFTNPLIFGSVVFVIVGGCIYLLVSHFSMDKTLKPVTRMAEVGEIASRVTHDLKGPLSGIRTVEGYFHQMQLNDPVFVRHLNLLTLSSKRLQKVVDDLLKKYQGKEEEKTIFNIHEVLDELIGEYSTQAVLDAILFQKKYVDRSVLLKGRRNRIERMFANIIKNSIEAMDFQGTIKVGAKVVDSHAVITIEDSGPGLRPEQIEKIMAGQLKSGKKDGHGIGLLFVREVIADHGGSLKVESEVGQGALFQFTLPLAQEELAPFIIEAHADQPILIIDDDENVLEQWRLLLGSLEVEAKAFSSYENFTRCQNDLPEMTTAIIDYHFENSELNGLEIIEKLKQQGFENLYLCTGEYWKPHLKKLVEEIKIEICPKPLPKIEIKTPSPQSSPIKGEGEESGYTVLVIDDDEEIRLSWDLKQKQLKIAALYCYPNMEALQGNGIDLAAVDLAFVDKNIEGSQYSGAAVIEYLKSKGVPKVILASGENEEELRKDPQLSKADFIIQDKIPSSFSPFL